MNSVSVSEMQEFGVVWPQCVARAWEDAEFRAALKSDPAGTLFKDFQFAVPQGLNLQIVDGDEGVNAQRSDTLRLVIPPAPDMDMREIALIGARDLKKEAKMTICFSITFC